MKLSEIEKENLPKYEHYHISFKDYPFYSLEISPKINPYGIFSFCVHTSESYGFMAMAYKTSYYTHPVISKSFSKESTIDEVVSWIEETLLKLRESLSYITKKED